MTTPKERAKVLVGLAIITVFFGIATGAFSAKADEPCKTPEALSHLSNIKKNQPRIAENREAAQRTKDAVANEAEINSDDVEKYNEFVRNKAWNASESEALHRLGCQVNWDTLTLEPFSQGATVTPKQLHSSADEWIDITQFTEKDMLSKEQLVKVLQDAGFSGEGLRTAYAVARAESSGRPLAHNNNPKTKDLSYGIFQINMRGSLGPDRRKRYSLNHNDDLYHPEINAKIAFAMSNGGKNWRPWGAYTNGSYRKHLNAL